VKQFYKIKVGQLDAIINFFNIDFISKSQAIATDGTKKDVPLLMINFASKHVYSIQFQNFEERDKLYDELWNDIEAKGKTLSIMSDMN